MMIDGKGCGLILGVAAFIGFLVGLIMVWFGAPWWTPVAAALAPPVAAAVIAVVFSVMLMGGAKH